MAVSSETIANAGNSKNPPACSPPLLIQFECESLLVTQRIASEVKTALIDHGPVQKLRARVMGVGVVVELVSNGHSPNGKCEAGNILLLCKLELAAIDLLLFSTKAPNLTQKEMGNENVSAVLAYLGGFSIGKRGNAVRYAKTKTLIVLWVKINLGARQQTSAKIKVRCCRLSKIVAGM